MRFVTSDPAWAEQGGQVVPQQSPVRWSRESPQIDQDVSNEPFIAQLPGSPAPGL